MVIDLTIDGFQLVDYLNILFGNIAILWDLDNIHVI